MLEGIDDPSVLAYFPVDMRPGRRTGHSDERDRLPARDMFSDGDERRGRVVVAALNTLGVLDADATTADLNPAGSVHRAFVGRDDDRAVGRRDVNAGVAALEELAHGSGHRADETARRIVDMPESRARRGVGAEIGTLSARDAAAIDLELRFVETGSAHAREPAAVGTEDPRTEQIGKGRDRVVLLGAWIPDRYAVEDVAPGHGRGHSSHENATVGGPSVDGTGERGKRSRLLHSARIDERELVVRANEKGLTPWRPFGERRVLILKLGHRAACGRSQVPLGGAVERIARDGESFGVGAEVRVVAGISRDEVGVDVADRLRDAVVPDADLVVGPEVEVIALPAHLRRRRLDRPGDRAVEVDVQIAIVAPVREIRA